MATGVILKGGFQGVEQLDRARSGQVLITIMKDDQRHHFNRPERHGHAD